MFSAIRKRFFVFPSVVVAIMACFSLVVFAMSAMAYSGGKVTSKKTSVPIKIDGELDDPAWQAVRPDFEDTQDIVVDPQDWYQVKEKSGNDTNNGGLRVSRGQIDGDNDLKVVWMTTWDDDYLYFAFEVTDDNVTEKTEPFESRSGDIDGFWLLFDTKHDAPVIEYPEKQFDTGDAAGQSAYQADDIFWTVAPVTTRGYPGVYEKADAEQPILNDPANGHAAGKQTSIGYNAEVRLPWSIFEPFYGGALVPKDGMVFGFDITFTDIDPTYAAPVGGAMAWSSDFENDNCPAVLGELFLSNEPAITGGTAVNPAGKLPSVWGKIKNR
ncbi:MAG: sugar-binding protein [Candidatus Poribacteria bacterium]